MKKRASLYNTHLNSLQCNFTIVLTFNHLLYNFKELTVACLFAAWYDNYFWGCWEDWKWFSQTSLHLSSFRDQLCSWHFALWWCSLLLQLLWYETWPELLFFIRYFRHASGTLVILSKNLAEYININRLVTNALTGKTGSGFNRQFCFKFWANDKLRLCRLTLIYWWKDLKI